MKEKKNGLINEVKCGLNSSLDKLVARAQIHELSSAVDKLRQLKEPRPRATRRISDWSEIIWLFMAPLGVLLVVSVSDTEITV